MHPTRHMQKSRLNMKKMMRSTVRSTWLRLDGGCVEFMKILVSCPWEGGSGPGV